MIHFPDWKMFALIPLLKPMACFGLIFTLDKMFGYRLIQNMLIFGDKMLLMIFGEELYIAHIESNFKVGKSIFVGVKHFSKH